MRKEIAKLHQIKLCGILASHHHLIQCLHLVHTITDEVIDACEECTQNRTDKTAVPPDNYFSISIVKFKAS